MRNHVSGCEKKVQGNGPKPLPSRSIFFLIFCIFRAHLLAAFGYFAVEMDKTEAEIGEGP
jgi:hypothetical protein